jgi:hypothetical protein
MKKTLCVVLVTLLVFGLTSCSISKQGKVVSVDVSFSLEDMLDGTIDNPVFGNTVTIETDNGKQFVAFWDEQLLGKPISIDLSGVIVEFKPTDGSNKWKVTKIIDEIPTIGSNNSSDVATSAP